MCIVCAATPATSIVAPITTIAILFTVFMFRTSAENLA
jgi:hypothetical protein